MASNSPTAYVRRNINNALSGAKVRHNTTAVAVVRVSSNPEELSFLKELSFESPVIPVLLRLIVHGPVKKDPRICLEPGAGADLMRGVALDRTAASAAWCMILKSSTLGP